MNNHYNVTGKKNINVWCYGCAPIVMWYLGAWQPTHIYNLQGHWNIPHPSSPPIYVFWAALHSSTWQQCQGWGCYLKKDIYLNGNNFARWRKNRHTNWRMRSSKTLQKWGYCHSSNGPFSRDLDKTRFLKNWKNGMHNMEKEWDVQLEEWSKVVKVRGHSRVCGPQGSRDKCGFIHWCWHDWLRCAVKGQVFSGNSCPGTEIEAWEW